jgi:AraC-like DNA-binding protein
MFKTSKPSFKQVAWNSTSCFSSKVDTGQDLSNAWHYHPEIEMILIKKSNGTRIIGNSVEAFGHNDFVLIGKNTPHAFLHDEKCREGDETAAEALVVQFSEDFAGSDFLRLSELKEVRELLSKAQYGLGVTENRKKYIVTLFEKIFTVPPFEGLLLLLEILKTMAGDDAHRMLANNKLHPHTVDVNDHRFGSILEYTYANFDEHIRIEDVARIANLTKESFCRYFKTQVNKTFVEFLTEYRISRACQMIRSGGKSIKEIGYACGFDSLSNFYYQFKKIMKLSPLEFNRQHIPDAGKYSGRR